ncbi:MAG: hypothetical protein RBT01_13835, partial [Anaerolineaceae bacterium]|nr:hypothetical protein [Anaerolineaceae bacterium]
RRAVMPWSEGLDQSPGQGRAAANHPRRGKPMPLHSQSTMTDLYVSKQTVAKMVGVMACPYPGSVHHELRGISQITVWGDAMVGGVGPITGAGTSRCPYIPNAQ